MTALLGNFSLSAAVLVSLLAFLAAISAGKFSSASGLRTARWLVVGIFAMFTLSSIALMIALVQSDFRFEYVAKYTERALPIGYKLAAFWAVQEGSLLLWAWLLAAMSAVAVFTHKVAQGPDASVTESASIVATLAIVCGFFAALMLFAANPFHIVDVLPSDGHGLNPMLQDPGMIAHPPMLFLGYAGYTIPFAFLVGALIAGRRDNLWIATIRRWALASWLLLSIGILLGAQWAYVELGWGGYWAWDPVENASLLPWLTGTALLHSIMIQQQRGMFKKWNALLIAVTFILCIFGTYLTRSGVIESVHSFGALLIGTFFLAFLVISIVFSVGIIIVRRRALKSEQELDGLAGKEGFFLAKTPLLVGMTLITLIGTIFPIISDLAAGQKVTVAPSFYNKVVAPLGLLLVALMAVGPLLVIGKDAFTRLLRGLLIPAPISAAVVITCIVMGLRNVWMIIAAAIAACAIASIFVDLLKSLAIRIRMNGENPITALLQLLDTSHRRYGGQTVHVGMLMIVVGITASSLFVQKENFSMKQGDTVNFAGRTITLSKLDPVRESNFEALQATLIVTDAAGNQSTLGPQIRQYDKWEQLNTEVAIHSNLREDIYVTVAATDGKGGITIQAIVNPLVSWIWIGGIVLTAGGILGLLPRLLPQRATSTSAVQVKTPASRISGKVRVQASA